MRGKNIETAFINDGISLKNYFKDIKKFPLVSGDEQLELVKKAQAGDRRALNKLVECNLRFVLTIAKEYINRGLDIEDLINEGNIGLIRAVDKFDTNQPVKFISYAVWWVRQSITQSICENGHTVRLPINKINDLHKISKAKDSLEIELGREPSYYEISKETGFSLKELKEISGSSMSEVSLDSKLGDDSESTVHDLIPSESYREVEEKSNYEALKYEILEMLDKLDERESLILKMFFGIGVPAMNLKDIGVSLDLTNERVRQLKEFALKRLRAHRMSKNLKEFLNGNI